TTASTPVFIDLGGGNDRLTFGTAAISLDGVLSPVTVSGGAGTDTIIMNDQADGDANSYTVTATNVTRGASEVLRYSAMESLTINAGNFNDTALVLSTNATTPVTMKM